MQSVERLQWWWKSLDDIERASASKISLLVESGEAIISAERLAWLAAFKKEQSEKAGAAGGDDDADSKAKQATHFKRGGKSVLGGANA